MSGTDLADAPATEGRNFPGRLNRDKRWQLALKIVATKGFAKSSFLAGFLLYICERHLLHRDEEITEQQVGVHVFGRPPGYNANDDNIVRNYARILRQRLDSYFQNEGANEEIHLVVPRGRYIPLFVSATIGAAEDNLEESELGVAAPVSEAEEIPDSARNNPIALSGDRFKLLFSIGSHRRAYISAALLLAVLSLSLVWGLASRKNWNLFQKQASASDIFWSSLFKADQDTFVVPSDSGLAIYEDLTGTSVDLGSYVRSDYPPGETSRLAEDLRLGKALGSRRYTSVVDLKLVSMLSRLPQVNATRLKIRYARELQLDDLKQSNAILIGSISANPWVELFQKDMNFQFYRDKKNNVELIHNVHPQAGEKEFYLTQEMDADRTTYGVIAFVPNLNHTGYVLVMEGINMAGTEGAAEFLMSSRANQLLERVTRNHTLSSPFEILIETSNIGANAPEPKMIGERIN